MKENFIKQSNVLQLDSQNMIEKRLQRVDLETTKMFKKKRLDMNPD